MSGNSFPIINLLQNARDGVSKSITVIDHNHHETHDGDGFYVEGNTTMSDTQEFFAKLVSPNTAAEMHLTWVIESNGILETGFWEEAKGGMAGGSTVTPINQP